MLGLRARLPGRRDPPPQEEKGFLRSRASCYPEAVAVISPENRALPTGCVAACPGCAHRTLSGEESAKQVNAWLSQELSPWATVLAPIRSPALRSGYRRKALLHARLIEGAWQFGMIRMRGWEEEFIPIPECPLHEAGVNARLGRVASKLPVDIPLRYVLVSGGALTLVVKEKRRAELAQVLRSIGAGEGESLWVNWNPGAGKRAIDGRYLELLAGEKWLLAGGLHHGPSAFRQQIPEMEVAALSLAEEFLAQADLSLIADFYSGLGASLHRWKARGWSGLGIELSGESVAAAEKNGVEVLRGRVEDRLPQMAEWLSGKPFVLYTNPSRAGMGPEVTNWILEQRPQRIAYLSCHPRSLAADLKALREAYEITQLHPFDFFPQTGHAETLALLNRK
jgi:23S rRNA (uracil1939-C5)-methyltransferase